jgi:hypothetical protein
MGGTFVPRKKTNEERIVPVLKKRKWLETGSKPEMGEDGHFNFQGAEKKAARMHEESPSRGLILEHKF